VGLLLIGLLDVTRTATVARDLGRFLNTVFQQAGFGAYTSDDVAQVFGWVITAVNLVGLVLAIWIAVPRLRTKRTAYWVPLLIGLVCTLLTTGLTLAAAVADPAFTAQLSR
jgi:Family of unknown function (DUF6264)